MTLTGWLDGCMFVCMWICFDFLWQLDMLIVAICLFVLWLCTMVGGSIVDLLSKLSFGIKVQQINSYLLNWSHLQYDLLVPDSLFRHRLVWGCSSIHIVWYCSHGFVFMDIIFGNYYLSGKENLIFLYFL